MLNRCFQPSLSACLTAAWYSQMNQISIKNLHILRRTLAFVYPLSLRISFVKMKFKMLSRCGNVHSVEFLSTVRQSRCLRMPEIMSLIELNSYRCENLNWIVHSIVDKTCYIFFFARNKTKKNTHIFSAL